MKSAVSEDRQLMADGGQVDIYSCGEFDAVDKVFDESCRMRPAPLPASETEYESDG